MRSSSLKITQCVIILLNLLVFTSLNASTALAPDYPREQRWANEVIPDLIVGEPLYFTQRNQHKFLGIFAETDNRAMAVIVVHGMGLHPDWGMISTIRQQLFDVGYSTLSIQMPILAADASYKQYPALFPEAVERLQISVQHLKKRGYKKITLISHSNGSRMSRIFMTDNPVEVTAWIALSLTQTDTYSGIHAPVFDLYGSEDLPHVLSAVNQRKASFHNKHSQQYAIRGADHFFNGKEDEMVKRIKSYLNVINKIK